MAKKTPRKSVLVLATEIANRETLRLAEKSIENSLDVNDARLLEVYVKLMLAKRESQLKMSKSQLEKVQQMTDEELKALIKGELSK